MSRGLWLAIGVGSLLLGGPVVEAKLAMERVEVDVAYVEALTRGIDAFRRGDLPEASRAFQDAYLIRPADPKLLSWMALVRDEQARRAAITEALDAAERRSREPVEAAAAAPIRPPREPLWQRLGIFSGERLGLEETVASVQSGRPEILETSKRAGFQRLYKEGIGYQPIRGLGFSGRTEIFAEPDPVEALEMDAKVLNFSEISQFRRSILPLFTRSGASRITADYEPLPRLTYEYDAREVLHQYQTKYAFKDIDLQTHAVNALYSFPRAPYLGIVTLNPWYKRVLQRSDHDIGSYEHRNEMIVNLSLQPSEELEYFFQFDGYDANKTRTVGGSKLKLYKGQVRWRVPRLKLFAIPSFEYSDTDFDPSDDEFTKTDVFVDWGFDLGEQWRVSSKEQWIFTELSQAGHTPSNPRTQVFNFVNTLSYELLKDLDVSLGFDYSKSAGFNSFNNVGLRTEVQLFKPGIIRSKFGYEWVSYYNIGSDLSLIYWKFFLFQ